MALSASFLIPTHQADAAVKAYPYNGLNNNNYYNAMNIKSNVGGVSIKHITNPENSGYSAVGRVSNYDGWKVMVKIAWEQVSLLMVTHTLQTYMLFKTVKVKLQDLKM